MGDAEKKNGRNLSLPHYNAAVRIFDDDERHVLLPAQRLK
jgi:hypothetical protein